MKKWIKREIARLETRAANDEIIGHVPGFIAQWLLFGGAVVLLIAVRAEGGSIMLVGNFVISTVRQIERERRLKAHGLEGTEE